MVFSWCSLRILMVFCRFSSGAALGPLPWRPRTLIDQILRPALHELVQVRAKYHHPGQQRRPRPIRECPTPALQATVKRGASAMLAGCQPYAFVFSWYSHGVLFVFSWCSAAFRQALLWGRCRGALAR